jgi:hypothetical protein
MRSLNCIQLHLYNTFATQPTCILCVSPNDKSCRTAKGIDARNHHDRDDGWRKLGPRRNTPSGFILVSPGEIRLSGKAASPNRQSVNVHLVSVHAINTCRAGNIDKTLVSTRRVKEHVCEHRESRLGAESSIGEDLVILFVEFEVGWL